MFQRYVTPSTGPIHSLLCDIQTRLMDLNARVTLLEKMSHGLAPQKADSSEVEVLPEVVEPCGTQSEPSWRVAAESHPTPRVSVPTISRSLALPKKLSQTLWNRRPLTSLSKDDIPVELVVTDVAKSPATATTASCSAAHGRYHVRICKDDKNKELGVDLRQYRDCLEVRSLGAGLLSKWNNDHPESTIRPRDLLLEVNGVSGLPMDALVLQAHRDRVLNMVFERRGSDDCRSV